MTQLTRLWTRDGNEWVVLGSPEEVELKVNQLVVNEKTKWATFREQGGRVVRIRKDFVAVIRGSS